MVSEIQLGSSLIIIAYFAISIVLVDAFFKKNKNIGYYYALLGLVLTFVSSILNFNYSNGLFIPSNHEEFFTKGMIFFGGYTSLFDMLFSLAGILTLFSAKDYIRKNEFEYVEFYSLVIFSITGMMLIAHSNHFLVLFIGIELMSIPFYILSGYFRRKISAIEAALKYFLLGAFATGFLVYGISLIYGATGSLYISNLSTLIANNSQITLYLAIGYALVLIGLSFKSAIAPFHQWAPDVYSGAPTVVTGFMSTAGKAAALIGLIIVTKPLLPAFNVIDEFGNISTNNLQMILAVMSALTMIIGNITALIQKNVKRMLAYSSVAHAGYLMMGIVADNKLGWQGITFYAFAYLFMQIGAFVIVALIETKEDTQLNIDDYAGLSKTNPILAAMMSLFMFSLAGIPPMAGFFGKYYLFTSVIQADFTWLAIIAVIATIISMYFYIGLIIQMYFKENDNPIKKINLGNSSITLFISTLAILLFGILPSLLVDLINMSF